MSKFVHMELSTSDLEAAQKFYKAIFGWKYQKMKMADGSVYVGFTADGEGMAGGMQKHPNPGAPPSWLGYVGVDSVKRTIAKVEKNGGKVLMPQMEVPGMGWLAIFTDPQGAMFAVWQAAARPAEAAPEPAAAAQAAPKKASKKTAGKKTASKKTAAAPEAAPAKKASKKTASKAAAGKPVTSKKSAKKSTKKSG